MDWNQGVASRKHTESRGNAKLSHKNGLGGCAKSGLFWACFWLERAVIRENLSAAPETG
jgi:hypothetical protein